MTIKRVTSPGSFRVLVGSRPYGSDPTWRGHTPPTPRNTMDFGPIQVGGAAQNGRVTPTTPPANQAGVFTVADNNFVTGVAELIIGNVRLRSASDYAIGAGAAATATNIATAINGLTLSEGISAVAVGADVAVEFSAPMDEVEFRALHYGTVVNFTPLAPANGLMAGGDPVIGPPVIT